MIFLNERFPTAVRATGTGLSWNAGYALRGMTPTLVTLLSPEVGHIPIRVTIACVVVTVLFLAGAAIAPETRGRDVRDVHGPDDVGSTVPATRAEARPS
ncbi:hypothetical protein [Pseudonocardia parietis]|uniref:Sugar transport protein n=1 Tax=Pseudonocardia parietis TaxID=570936 RepID=A0ABS4VMH1_9PSEU|nr:hypothetical protein [Pseudonocardia parietis]MBP2365119.1 hypothetical protein [Pseudonocardia parietis]